MARHGVSLSRSTSKDADRGALIHRETIQLVVLLCVAVAAIFATRAVAANNHNIGVRNAAEWYRRGEQFVAAGRIDEAIDALRRATVRNRENRVYMVALARALALKADYDSARALLLTVRERAPEDAQVNLDLARLAAARQDVTEALRFYHDALYAPWPGDQAEPRRAVRMELIRFLLTHREWGRAESELLAAAADLPDDAAHHGQVGELFAQAGDDRNALLHFQRALRLDPNQSEVLAGAANAAFRLGQYALAQRYLHRVPKELDGVQDIRETVELVLSRDPSAARIGARERRRRLDADLAYAQRRLADCLAQHDSVPSPVVQSTLQTELHAFERRLPASAALDQDTIESGLDLIERVEQDVIASCGPATAVDHALLLIAKAHETGSP